MIRSARHAKRVGLNATLRQAELSGKQWSGRPGQFGV